MIKLVYVVARREDVPADRFYDYWLNSHGPRVRSHANAIHARKYIQSHLIDTPLNREFQEPRGMLDPVAGITEVWWDSPADFERGGDDPARAAATRDLAEDEAKFADIARSQVFLTEEHTIFDYTGGAKLGPDAIKVTYLLSKRDSLSRRMPQDLAQRSWAAGNQLRERYARREVYPEPHYCTGIQRSHSAEPRLRHTAGWNHRGMVEIDGRPDRRFRYTTRG